MRRYRQYRKMIYANCYMLRIQAFPNLRNRRGRGMSPETVKEIRRAYDEGGSKKRGPHGKGSVTQKSLAERYGVSSSAISQIISGITYQDKRFYP